jgi:hypothetical protein
MDEEIAVGADGEITFAPTGDIVHFGGVGHCPTIGRFTNLGATAVDFSGQSSGLPGWTNRSEIDGSNTHSIRT